MTKSISKRTLDFISFIPFGIAISAFILYLRYALPVLVHEKIAVTGLILSYANSYSSTVSKNIELERHKKTALKHSSSMNECATQKLWR